MTRRPVLHIVPTSDGRPSIEDLIALTIALTGRQPTPKKSRRRK